ncbi:ABC transporter ATP-binding protein [Streptomyces sp. NPDC057748]|uniref:ABC transporter ATP-binding protein n=1 Tax=unclassified Streptomyces TaxID=2593676 RepID=UPI00368A67AF
MTLLTKGSGTSHMLRLAWRTDQTVVSVIIALAAAQTLAVAATGLSQRWVVDAVHGASGDAAPGLLLAVTVGAVAHVTIAAGNRTRYNYQHDLTDRVDTVVSEEILTVTSTIPSLEHLERTDYLDRLALLRRHTKALAGSCWAMSDTAISVISAGLSLCLLVGVHPALAGLALLALPPLWAAKRAQSHLAQARKSTAESQRHEDHLHRMCIEPDTGKELYVSGAGPLLDRLADDACQRVLTGVLKARVRAVSWQLSGWACYALGYIAALVLTARMVSRGEVSLGDLMLVITLGTQLRGQVRAAVNGFSRIADAGHASEHYVWLREYAEQQRPTGTRRVPNRLQRGIELRDVDFTYPGAGEPVLRGVNLTLRAGSTVALVGVNGAGKTTLVKLLSGMYTPTAGTVTVDGVPLAEFDMPAWRHELTGVFQDFVRFQLPVRHTVGIGHLPSTDNEEDVSHAVREAGASPLVDGLPDGLGTQLGRLYEGQELSHGQWQRLALARALMRRRPTLLVLDEPTAALDPLAEHELHELFLRQTGGHGRITLLVSHRFSTVRNAETIVVLDGGHVSEHGSHDELMASGGRYSQLYTTQATAYR